MSPILNIYYNILFDCEKVDKYDYIQCDCRNFIKNLFDEGKESGHLSLKVSTIRNPLNCIIVTFIVDQVFDITRYFTKCNNFHDEQFCSEN